jgi:hypothetical protein
MERWFKYAPVDFRPCPSAMFTGIDTAARLIWLISPNRSSLGKEPLTA